jgi:hypothetical protein
MEKQMKNEKIVQDNKLCRFILADDEKVLLLDWKHVTGLSLVDFKNCVAEFASNCKRYKPVRVVIDARELDPNGDVIGWVSGQKRIEGEEEYNSWWIREIVPFYHEAGISVLSVATGNPNAPGELPNVPKGVNFRIGYFTDLETAMQWKNS